MDAPARRKMILRVLAAGAALALLGGLIWHRLGPLTTFSSQPVGVMGTDCTLMVVAHAYETDKARKALEAAETTLRNIEARMSHRLEFSEIGRLNAARAGQVVNLSAETLEVLRSAQAFTQASDGAFDVTVLPILRVWGQAAKDKRLPTEQQLGQARELTGWRHFEFVPGGVRKLTDGAAIDLGGIAKKHGIDKAVEAMRACGVAGGLVNVGGDIRVFGRRAGGGRWLIEVRGPFGRDHSLGMLGMDDGSVCTSGNYERYSVIDGKRYSHIVDPRTGWPCDATPSVTVVGPTALEAGLWATALSVLGPEGLSRMDRQRGLEALLVVGDDKQWRLTRTAGFDRYATAPIADGRAPRTGATRE